MKYLLILIIAFLAACETVPKNPEAWMEMEKNSCLPTAIVFKQALRKYDVWARVFTYQYNPTNSKALGHAMVAYLYPPGENKLWTYDSFGSFRIRAYTNDLATIARISHYSRGGSNVAYNAVWVD